MSSANWKNKSNNLSIRSKPVDIYNEISEISLKNDIYQNTESTLNENTKNTLQRSGQDDKKKGKWTKEEDEILERVVMTYGQKSWKKVSEFVKGRTPIQCLHRWTKILKPGLIKGPWTIEQDRKLLDWVKREGPGQWSQCAEFITGRSGKQCRERWFNTLNPEVIKGNWTPEEDFIIFDSYRQFGSHWTKIAEKLAGRTENSIKNRFYSTLRRISSRKKAEKNQVESISSSSIPLNKLVEYLPEALLEKTMNFIKYKNDVKPSEILTLESEKMSLTNNINQFQNLKDNMPSNKIENNNQISFNSVKNSNNVLNTQNMSNNFNNCYNNNYQSNFAYNLGSSFPVNNSINERINFDNKIKMELINNQNFNHNQFIPNISYNLNSNIYNPINHLNNKSGNILNNNLYNSINPNHNFLDSRTYNNNEFNNNHDHYNQLKDIPLDILENNIENLCEMNPFNEPNMSMLDNQINDFIENFFENNNIEDHKISNNIYCFGCYDNNKETINKGVKIDLNNEANNSKEKVFNSLLDQLNELEKLLHNSKNELINKLNNLNNQEKTIT